MAQWPYLLAYNVGRITSYSIAGALTGFAGAIFTRQLDTGIHILSLVSAVFLLLLAAYIGGWWQVLTLLERAGSHFWRRIQPWGKRFLPFTHWRQALPYGIIWGWLPCGLVYSTLTWSLASGSALNGAFTMLAFGLGTLPAMVAMGAGMTSVKAWMAKPWIRQGMALFLLLYSLMLIYRTVVN